MIFGVVDLLLVDFLHRYFPVAMMLMRITLLTSAMTMMPTIHHHRRHFHHQ
jgi:cell division protein FtsL